MVKDVSYIFFGYHHSIRIKLYHLLLFFLCEICLLHFFVISLLFFERLLFFARMIFNLFYLSFCQVEGQFGSRPVPDGQRQGRFHGICFMGFTGDYFDPMGF